MSIDEVLRRLNTTPHGLSDREAEKRLRKFGPNELRGEKGISRLNILLNQFRSILVIILIIATVLSALLGNIIDSIAIVAIVILNAVFGFLQEYKAEKTIEALKRLAQPEAVVIRNGKRTRIPSKFLVPGDVVILEHGGRVPADIRIMESAELQIDEAIITGESVPVAKFTKPVKTTTLAEMKNIAFMGTMVTHGRGCGVVISTGMHTEVGKIAHTIEEKPEVETPLQKRLNTFGRKLGIFIILICTVVTVMGITREGFLTGKLITNNLIIRMVMTGISLAVAAIPEGLPAVVTITLAIGLKRLSEKNTLVRRLPITETLGSVTVICTDKTGTLTRNEMTVNRIWYIGREIQVEGSGYKPSGGFYTENKRIDPKKDKNLVLLLRTAALCNNSTLEKRRNTWSVIGDPTEGALLVAAAKAGFKHETLTKEYPRIKEIPFTSERKMMTTINTHNGRFIVSVKGAPEKILTLCKRYYINGRTRRLTKKETKIIMEENHNLTSNALRVLAVAYKETKRKPENPENDLVFLGLVGMMDLPREGVREDIELCKRAGIKVVMITGDHRNTAIAIARQLGLDSGRAITGEELDRIPDEDFENMVEDISVYARVNPEHKVRIVDALRKRGHVIAMTGDGVNDAPALKDADIGIAMGIKGTDVAKEASDMILRDDNFSSIVTAVKEGRTIYDNIKKFIQYLLSCNTAEVMIVFMAMMIGLVDPTTGLILLPVQLLWINILTDALPALALGIDPPSRDIMERKPRDPKENILSREMVSDIVIVSIIMTLGTLLLFWWNLVTESGIKAMTVAFTLIVMFEMVRVQSVRMKFRIGIFSNRKLIAAIVTSIFLQIMVVYIPAMQVIFRTVSLTLWDWIEIILMSSTVMIIMWFKERVIPWNG